MDSRAHALANWCQNQINELCSNHSEYNQQEALASDSLDLKPVSGDASFRRYFRIDTVPSDLGERYPSLIAMDAPPEKEDSSSFVAIANYWYENNIQVPKILALDLDLGFLLLEDFGDSLLLSALGEPSSDISVADPFYQKAFDALIQIQSLAVADQLNGQALPPFDHELLQREMSLFRDWLVGEKLGLELSKAESDMMQDIFDFLESNALDQMQVCVHRDYHSRNLMCLENKALGIIDFQDAVTGPITYDLVSLLRDCYIQWPIEAVENWVEAFYKQLTEANPKNIKGPLPDLTTFKKWFDLMGMQRHLKASGIFARLSIRDGKHGYLEDIPRTLSYIISVGKNHPETALFAEWVEARVLPAINDSLSSK